MACGAARSPRMKTRPKISNCAKEYCSGLRAIILFKIEAPMDLRAVRVDVSADQGEKWGRNKTKAKLAIRQVTNMTGRPRRSHMRESIGKSVFFEY